MGPFGSARADRCGAKRIADERQRQIDKEGWTPEHDDEHDSGELAWAAVCYAAPKRVFVRTDLYEGGFRLDDPWPEWDPQWDKRPKRARKLIDPTLAQRIRMLEKAGALIAAEIDRLLRIEEKQPR